MLEQTQTNKIKAWLDYLYYEVGKQQYDFELQVSDRDGKCGAWNFCENKEERHSKPRKYSDVCFEWENNKWFLSNVNQRRILPCEVVLDIEDKDKLPETLIKLRGFKVPYYPFTTGSKGFHIHLFFNMEISDNHRLAIIKYFGADEQKKANTNIALEFAKHWKSGKVKELIDVSKIEGGSQNANLV
jgi:hypothetical protein